MVNKFRTSGSPWMYKRFFLLSMLSFGPGANVAFSEIQIFQKLGLPYLTKRCLKLFGKRAIIWLRFQNSILNIFRDRFWKLANFSLALLIKVLLVKKACKLKEPSQGDVKFLNASYTVDVKELSNKLTKFLSGGRLRIISSFPKV